MIRLLKISLILLGLGLVVNAQQRPLLTEDVDIVPEGAVRISAGVDFLQNAKFPLSGLKGDLTRVGDLDIRFGLSSNVEFQIQGTLQNFLAINSAGPSAIPLTIGANSTNDIGDFTLATKVKVLNEGRYRPSIGVKLAVQMPNTNQAKGIGTNQMNLFGTIILQKKFGTRKDMDPQANVFGNIGLGIMPAPLERFAQNDVLLYGAGGVFRINRRINIAGEINGRANTRSGAAPLGTESISLVRIGTQIKASGLRFDTAAIFGLTKHSPRSGFTFGVTYQSPQVFNPAK